VGNRLSSLSVPSYEYNVSNEITSTSIGTYSYDANGNTLTDPSGWTYTWDFENHLSQMTLPGGAEQSSSNTIHSGSVSRRRSRRTERPIPPTTFYDSTNHIEEVDAAGGIVSRYRFPVGR
jgi:YD repeat-containing protein